MMGPTVLSPVSFVLLPQLAWITTALPGLRCLPEEPAANNPPDGAILDYVLPAQAGEVNLTIFDQHQQIVRHFSNTDQEAGKRPPMAIAERWFPKPQRIEEHGWDASFCLGPTLEKLRRQGSG